MVPIPTILLVEHLRLITIGTISQQRLAPLPALLSMAPS